MPTQKITTEGAPRKKRRIKIDKKVMANQSLNEGLGTFFPAIQYLEYLGPPFSFKEIHINIDIF